MISLSKFGDMEKHGYCGSFDLLVPIIKFKKDKYLDGRTFNNNIISLPTKIVFTNESYCVNIEIVLLGFGLRFIVNERSLF